MNISGMKTTMSLEISKPTEAINEISEHDTDINITSGDTGMDAASDEMSNVSTEFQKVRAVLRILGAGVNRCGLMKKNLNRRIGG